MPPPRREAVFLPAVERALWHADWTKSAAQGLRNDVLANGLFPQATCAHFDELAQQMPSERPRGRLLFAAGPVRGGWQVVQVWESKELLDTFNRAVLLPALGRLGESSDVWVPSDVVDLEPTQLSLAPLPGY